jgi:deoxyribodipyrimidine photo-lyase
MSRDQRVRDNYALYEAQRYALERNLPLLVLFVMFTQPTIRLMQHYEFMVEGLKEVEDHLRKKGIGFLLTTGDAVEQVCDVVKAYRAAAVFLDVSPLGEAVNERFRIGSALDVPCFEVDTTNIVPLWIASDKEEFAARTIRPKIHRLLPDFLEEPPQVEHHPYPFPGRDVNDWDAALAQVTADRPDFYRPAFTSGEDAAATTLTAFLAKLARYGEDRNKPDTDALSNLSPYLHYGQIYSGRAVLAVRAHADASRDPVLRASADAFIEEIVVRRELAQNYCYYNKEYTSMKGAKPWARQTLERHLKDPRDHEYSLDELETARTYDEAWNAAQTEMMTTGKMHGYMRMYWAKKVLEWSRTPDDAIRKLVYLNDKYHLDGFDANGYVGIMWAVAGIHDRPWFERPIYGSIRYMNDNGLRRKFDLEAYISRWRGS